MVTVKARGSVGGPTMHCLVTGGAGFVGSHLVDLLREEGHEVRVFDNLSSGRRDFLSHHGDEVSLVIGDLLDLEAVKGAMEGIEIVYHLAANPDIRLGTSVTDTDLNQGTVATYNVLEAMRVAGVQKIAFASSSVVYGEATEMPTPEDYGPLFPISLYGASKLGSEAHAALLHTGDYLRFALMLENDGELDGVRVLSRQHPVAAGDERDVRSERVVGGGELRARDARADHHELLRQLVHLRPGILNLRTKTLALILRTARKREFEVVSTITIAQPVGRSDTVVASKPTDASRNSDKAQSAK